MGEESLIYRTARSLATAIKAREVSPLEVLDATLARIDEVNGKVNAVVWRNDDEARAAAVEATNAVTRGDDLGPFHGVPIPIKDLTKVAGWPVTYGSWAAPDGVSDETELIVDAFRRAGFILTGRTNTPEFGPITAAENDRYGITRNPWDLDRTPGGSSGGSGAAVAAEMVFAATGTDTGGSIRIPASFCGVVGLKPTYGRVSRYGALPLSFSLDHVGPLARTVRDAALVLSAIAGYDPRDPASARNSAPDFVPPENCDIRGLRIGIPDAFFFERLDPEVEAAVRAALARVEELGGSIRPVRLPDMPALHAVGNVIQLSEFAALMEPRLQDRALLGADVRLLLEQGRLLPATDYVNAQRLRRRIQLEFSRVWQAVDCLLTPTTPVPAPPIGASAVSVGGQDEDVRAAATRFVRGFNTLGVPALSVPCGFTRAGLPTALQIVGPPFQEGRILQVGAALY